MDETQTESTTASSTMRSNRRITLSESHAALDLADELNEAHRNVSEQLADYKRRQAPIPAAELQSSFEKAIAEAVRRFDERRHAIGVRLA